MNPIEESPDPPHWPRKKVDRVETRSRDLVVRITDWTDDKDEPAWDVECYIGGVYDWGQSQSFPLRDYHHPFSAKMAAIQYAAMQIGKLL